MGYGFTDSDTTRADIVLFNTCAVRENAEDRVLRRCSAQLKHNKTAQAGPCSSECAAAWFSRQHITEQHKKELPPTWIMVFGPHVLQRRFPAADCTRRLTTQQAADINTVR